MLAIVVLLVGPVAAQTARIGPSGLPLPRFVSLRSDTVNVRGGPSSDHDLLFTYVKAGLPVEIIQEFDNWRRIRDFDGDDGWIFHKLLSGQRTALVQPPGKDNVGMYADPDLQSRLVAWLEPRVLVKVRECTGAWCRVSVDPVDGWVEQVKLYGVYPDERF